jgi:uncharacterized protein YndB with AHSA1/START domain
VAARHGSGRFGGFGRGRRRVIEIEDRVWISSSPATVFQFAARPENMASWVPAITESTVLGRLRRGAKVVQRANLLGRSFETVYQVTEYEPFDRIVYTSTTGPMDVRGVMAFRAEEGGTSVRWSVSGDCRGFFRASERMLVAVGRREMHLALQKLKHVMIARSSPDRSRDVPHQAESNTCPA